MKFHGDPGLPRDGLTVLSAPPAWRRAMTLGGHLMMVYDGKYPWKNMEKLMTFRKPQSIIQ